MNIMSFNPDLNKQAQEDTFSRAMAKSLTNLFQQYIRNLSDSEIKFLLSYLSEKCSNQCKV